MRGQRNLTTADPSYPQTWKGGLPLMIVDPGTTSDQSEEVEPDTFRQRNYWAMVPEWVIYHPELTDGAVRFYAVLARVAHDGQLWRSQSWLAEHTGKSERAVRGYISELKKVGALSNEKRKFNGPTNWTLETDPPRSEVEEGSDRAARNCLTSRQESASLSGKKLPPNPEPLIHSQLSKADSPDLFEPEPPRAVDETVAKELDARFEEIWKNYPRKVDKKESFAAFKARVKQGVPSEELAAAVLTYASQRKNEDPKFTLLGKTFFGPNEKWKRYLPGEDPQAEDNGRYFDEDGDEVSESAFNAQNLDKLHRSPEMRKWA